MTTNNEHTQVAETNRLPVETEAPPQYRELTFEDELKPLHLTLKPPIEFDGETFAELLFDYNGVVGKDFLRAEREFVHRYKPEKNEVVIPEVKQLFRCILAAHTANVPLAVIERLPGRYYTAVINDVLKLYGNSLDEEKA
jgi:hypothetical protein